MIRPDFSRPIPDDPVLSATIDDLNAFHDPTGAIREQLALGQGLDYTPKSLFNELASKLYPEEVTDLGAYGTGQEMIFMNAVYLGLSTEGLGDFLGLAQKRANTLEAVAHRKAAGLAEAIYTVGSSLRLQTIPGFEHDTLMQRRVAIGRSLGAIAHDGQVRRNGKPYVTHIEGAASIAREAWSATTHEPIETLYASQLALEGHDGPEDSMDSMLLHLAQPKPFVSPLSIEKLSLRMADDSVIAQGIGRSTMLMMHVQDIYGAKNAYTAPLSDQFSKYTYISRLLTYGSAYTALPEDMVAVNAMARKITNWAKPFDKLHNKTDSGVNELKRLQYTFGLKQMEDSVAAETDLPAAIRAGRKIAAAKGLARERLEEMPGFDAPAVATAITDYYKKLVA